MVGLIMNDQELKIARYRQKATVLEFANEKLENENRILKDERAKNFDEINRLRKQISLQQKIINARR